MRVLHSVERWLPRTQPWIRNQLRYLPNDVVCDVVCRATENLDAFPWPRIHSLTDEPLLRQLLDRGLRALGIRHHLGIIRRRVLQLEPGILHSHFGHVGWQNLGAIRGTSTRHVVTFYGQDVSWLPTAKPRWRDRYQRLFAEADLFLCEGPHMASELAGLGCPGERIRIHRLGVELERIEFQPRRWPGDEPLRVLMAASFREKKGIPYGIRALGRLRDPTSIELTLVGDAVDQPGSQKEKGRILEALRETGMDDVTRMPGFLSHSELMEEAYRHHLFLSPSVTAHDGDTEGGAPVVLLDMAASGMPIVSTRHCDIPEVVVDGANAVLTNERDVDGLVTAILSLAQAPDWPQRLRAGRRHVETRFDARTQANDLAGLYRSLMAE